MKLNSVSELVGIPKTFVWITLIARRASSALMTTLLRSQDELFEVIMIPYDMLISLAP